MPSTVPSFPYSRRTERAYAMWVKRFVLFHDTPHPNKMAGGISHEG